MYSICSLPKSSIKKAEKTNKGYIKGAERVQFSCNNIQI